ncbi:MAG: hypothetical protein WBZ36_06615 [Candidatus Nitrosopolaris sp.]
MNRSEKELKVAKASDIGFLRNYSSKISNMHYLFKLVIIFDRFI